MNYSCFIGYHGSYDKNGTYGIALAVKDFLQNYYDIDTVYCGPDTNEALFTQHMTVVIPFSKLFLFVVNDSAVTEEEKKLEPEKYISQEIMSFIRLVKMGARNPKDFAVLYVGTKKENRDDKIQYVKDLISKLDPENLLSEGNQYFITDLKDLTKWFTERTRNNSSRLLYEDNEPFEPLTTAVNNMYKGEASNSLLLIGEPGVGKTKLVDQLLVDDKISGKKCIYHFTNDQTSSKLSSFLTAIRDTFQEKHKDLVSPYEYDFLNDKHSFARYLNALKAKMPNKNILLILDSIDCVSSNGKISVLDYFDDLSNFDEGIFFVFTTKEESLSSTSSYQKFIANFKGEKVVINKDSGKYRSFLRSYYNKHIANKCPNSSENDERLYEAFDKINPKDLFSFALLFRLVTLYVTTIANDNNIDVSVFESIEAALSTYYEYIYQKGASNFNEVIDLLALICLSKRAISHEELEALANNFASGLNIEKVLTNNSTITDILVNVHNLKGETYYSIFHQSLIDTIVKKNMKEVYTIMNNYKDCSLFTMFEKDYPSLLEFLDEEKYVHFYFERYLSYEVEKDGQIKTFGTDEEKMRVLRRIYELLPTFTFYSTTSPIIAERIILNAIVNSKYFANFNELEQAIILAKLGGACVCTDDFDLGEKAFNKACEYFETVDFDSLTDREALMFVECFQAYGTNLCSKEGRYTIQEAFGKSIPYARKLMKKGILPVPEYCTGLLAYGNVSSGYGNGDFVTDKACLEECESLLTDFSNPKVMGRRGHLYKRYAEFYKRQDLEDKNGECLDISIESYEKAFSMNTDAFYLGDLFITYGEKVYHMIRKNKPFEEIEEFVQYSLSSMNEKIKKTHFINPKSEMALKFAIADFYLSYKKPRLAAAMLDNISNYLNDEEDLNTFALNNQRVRLQTYFKKLVELEESIK